MTHYLNHLSPVQGYFSKNLTAVRVMDGQAIFNIEGLEDKLSVNERVNNK